jgi:hypothetical protein
MPTSTTVPKPQARPLCIQLTGPAGSGKSVAARYLTSKYGLHEFSYAQPLKRAVTAIFGIPYTDLFDQDAKARPCSPPWQDYTPRRILQIVGTDLFRQHFDQDIWVKAMVANVYRLTISAGSPQPIVISDCRFPNELERTARLLPTHRCISFKLLRNIGPLAGGIPGHPSEQDLNADCVVNNTGGVVDLYRALDNAMACASELAAQEAN